MIKSFVWLHRWMEFHKLAQFSLMHKECFLLNLLFQYFSFVGYQTLLGLQNRLCSIQDLLFEILFLGLVSEARQ